jgi:hypothetical protein
MTLQELLELLKRIPRRVRESNYPMIVYPDNTIGELRSLHFAQSDQAEKWEFKVYISTTRSRE